MYHANIETNAAAKARHDENLKANSKGRLAFNAARKKLAKCGKAVSAQAIITAEQQAD